MKKSIIAAIITTAFTSFANAEPVALNNDQMDGITAGTGYTVYFNKYVNTYDNFYLNDYKRVNVAAYVSGQTGQAQATSACLGYNCVTQTTSDTYTAPGITTSLSSSISARSW